MSLNGVIALTSLNRGVMSPNSVAFWTDYVKVDTLCSRNVGQRIKFLVIYHGDIGTGIAPSKSVNLRHSPLASENLTNSRSHNLETVQDRRYRKLILTTNRKTYTSFQLAPKSVTLHDLERRNGRYIALFH